MLDGEQLMHQVQAGMYLRRSCLLVELNAAFSVPVPVRSPEQYSNRCPNRSKMTSVTGEEHMMQATSRIGVFLKVLLVEILSCGFPHMWSNYVQRADRYTRCE